MCRGPCKVPGYQEHYSNAQNCVSSGLQCSIAEGGVAAVFGHDEDGAVREELHGGLHIALLCFYAAKCFYIQDIN